MAKKRTPPKQRTTSPSADRSRVVERTEAVPLPTSFDVVLGLIESARTRVMAAANQTLIELYWSIGEYISQRVSADGWGEGTVQSLASYIRGHRPNARGFSAQNLWRMRQFYDAYRDQPKLSALLRELSWTNNMLILGKSKREEERAFYLRLASTQKWSSRELERQTEPPTGWKPVGSAVG